jgi:hypothetical protein
MKNDKNQIDQYLEQYPKLARWLNTCVTCGATGHDPAMPEQISSHEFSVAGKNLRRFFTPLAVDEQGHCKMCQGALGKNI